MSNSYKHTPVTGNTTAVSEKDDKQRASRRKRHAVKQHLATLSEAEEENCKDKGNTDPYLFAKDGKGRCTVIKYLRK